MRPLRLVGLALLAALIAATPVHAADVSPGVSLLRTIPEPGVVSARAVGTLLYVSALSGVSIYDVSDPRARSESGGWPCRTPRTRTWTSATESCS